MPSFVAYLTWRLMYLPQGGAFNIIAVGLGFNSIDPAFLAMAPNIVTIVAMAVFATRVRPPAALARPFIRGLK